MTPTTTFVWLVIAFAIAMALAFLLTPVVIRAAEWLRLFDSPDGGRRMHAQPVPRLGGIAVYLAAAASACFIFVRTSPRFTIPGPIGDEQISFLTGAFVGSGLLFIAGLVDDLRGLSAGAKFLLQVAAAGIAIYFGARLGTIALGYGEGVPLGILELPLLLVWIVGVTNAFNFIDGLDGLAGGIAVVATAAILIAAVSLGNAIVLVPAVAIAGALLAFLRFNFPRAGIFLGDSGSLSIGFLLAVLSLRAAENSFGAVLIVVPVLAVFVPLLDGALAIVRRWLRRAPVAGADARHIHHRLLALGLTPRRTAMILWGMAASMAGFGLLIALTRPFVATSVAIFGLVGLSVLIIYGTNLLSYHELLVAGEVLMSAPARARRIISDQILAVDLATALRKADDIEKVSTVLAGGAGQFGFLDIVLSGEGIQPDPIGDRYHTEVWAWKLDYPIRIEIEGRTIRYVLSIWCSPERSTRPYGAERVARILGPALQFWFEAHHRAGVPSSAPGAIQALPAARRRLKVR